MRRIFVASVVLAVISLAGVLATTTARSMTAPVAAGLAPAIDQANPVEDVAYVCRRVRRCGPYGCGWRRECWETGPGYGPGYYRGYGGGGWNTWNGCPPNYTIQDGVCKPYRGY
ncbi:MAG TPA: hypothetical protein VIV34_06495 [Pseudolabrys sp.]